MVERGRGTGFEMTDFEYYLKLYKNGVTDEAKKWLDIEHAHVVDLLAKRQRAWDANDSMSLLACDRLVYSLDKNKALYAQKWCESV